jgi:hypothetical protein
MALNFNEVSVDQEPEAGVPRCWGETAGLGGERAGELNRSNAVVTR